MFTRLTATVQRFNDWRAGKRFREGNLVILKRRTPVAGRWLAKGEQGKVVGFDHGNFDYPILEVAGNTQHTVFQGNLKRKRAKLSKLLFGNHEPESQTLALPEPQ